MSHTEYSAQFVQYSSVFLGLEEAPLLAWQSALGHHFSKIFRQASHTGDRSGVVHARSI